MTTSTALVPAALVTVERVRGSAPREAGAWMIVTNEGSEGTIGGGRLEYLAMEKARALLAGEGRALDLALPLGPEIGQCCGGHVALSIRRVDEAVTAEIAARRAEESAVRPEVLVFGAGHTGLALARALALLPVRTALIDTRAEALSNAPEGIETHCTALPEHHVRAAAPGSAFVVLTHDHALDFLIAGEALARGDAAYVGLIGSATKRARFSRWLAGQGGGSAAALTCPIGAPTRDKRPEVIAAFTATEVMARLAAAIPARQANAAP
ncbi:MAG: xanthine dehydrogenase accessory protein XdhC [Pseudomonadota bacterium]